MARQKKTVKTIIVYLRQMMAEGVLDQEQAEMLEDVIRRLGHGAATRNPREIDKVLQDLVHVFLK